MGNFIYKKNIQYFIFLPIIIFSLIFKQYTDILLIISLLVTLLGYYFSFRNSLSILSKISLRVTCIYSFLIFFLGPLSSFFYSKYQIFDNQDFDNTELGSFSPAIFIGIIWTSFYILSFLISNSFYKKYIYKMNFSSDSNKIYYFNIQNTINKYLQYFNYEVLYLILFFSFLIRLDALRSGCLGSLSSFLDLDCPSSLLLTLSNIFLPICISISFFFLPFIKNKYSKFFIIFFSLINLFLYQVSGDRRTVIFFIAPYLVGIYFKTRKIFKNLFIIAISSFFILSLLSPFSELLGSIALESAEVDYFQLFFKGIFLYFDGFINYISKTILEVGYSFDYSYITKSSLILRDFVTRDTNCYPLLNSINASINKLFNLSGNEFQTFCNAEFLLFKQSLILSGNKPYLVNPAFSEAIVFGGYNLLVIDSMVRGALSSFFILWLNKFTKTPYYFLIFLVLVTDIGLFSNSWNLITYNFLLRIIFTFILGKILFLKLRWQK